jgi:hypothetical protein
MRYEKERLLITRDFIDLHLAREYDWVIFEAAIADRGQT